MLKLIFLLFIISCTENTPNKPNDLTEDSLVSSSSEFGSSEEFLSSEHWKFSSNSQSQIDTLFNTELAIIDLQTKVPNSVLATIKITNPTQEYGIDDFLLKENGLEITTKSNFSTIQKLDSSTQTIETKTSLLINNSMLVSTDDFERSKMDAIRFIENTSQSHFINIYTYSEEVSQKSLFINDKAKLKELIMSLTRYSTSNKLYEALYDVSIKATSSKKINPYQKISLITFADGINNSSDFSINDFSKYFNNINAFSIYYNDVEDLDFFNLVQAKNRFENPAEQTIDLIIKQIEENQESIESFYNIEYESFERGNHQNELNISLVGNENSTDETSFNSNNFTSPSLGLRVTTSTSNISVDTLKVYQNTIINTNTFIFHNPWKDKQPDFQVKFDFSLYQIDKHIGEEYLFTSKLNNDTTSFITIIDRSNLDTLTLKIKTIPTDKCVTSLLVDQICDFRDGKIYHTKQIGQNRWFTHNLDYKTSESVCYNNEPSFCTKYGALYKSNSLKKDLCPENWRISTFDDWNVLINDAALELELNPTITDSKLKIKNSLIGDNFWNDGFKGSNQMGLNIIGSGAYEPPWVNFYESAENAYLWMTPTNSGYTAVSLGREEKPIRFFNARNMGYYSIRCVKE